MYKNEKERMKHMKKRALFLFLALALGLGLATSAWGAGKFTDVKPGDYYAEAVDWAVERGITAGTSDTTFSPDQTCTRGQILTFVWRAIGAPDTYSPIREVSDVSPNAYYYRAVLWAEQFNLFDGNEFRPNDPCTRLEAMELLWRLSHWREEHWQKTSDSGFSDTDSQAVKWAVDRGVTTGTSAETFSPEQICTRGQIVSFLYRHYSVNPFDTFACMMNGSESELVITESGDTTVKVEFKRYGTALITFPHLDLSAFRDYVSLNAPLISAPGSKVRIDIYPDYADVQIESSEQKLTRFNGKYLRKTGGFASDQLARPEEGQPEAGDTGGASDIVSLPGSFLSEQAYIAIDLTGEPEVFHFGLYTKDNELQFAGDFSLPSGQRRAETDDIVLEFHKGYLTLQFKGRLADSLSGYAGVYRRDE